MDSLTPSLAATEPALPPEAPLQMPEGVLHAPGTNRPFASAPRLLALRRLLVVGGAVALTAAGGYQMYRVLGLNGLNAPSAIMVLLFVLLFFWIALAFTSAIAGFAWLLSGSRHPLRTDGELTTRTALLMPSYNEDPARTAAALLAMGTALAAKSGLFDVFILSDTTNAEIWLQEEAAFLALRRRLDGRISLFYRRRPLNTARKAGNIADWVRRFGAAYPQFLILDADSVMEPRHPDPPGRRHAAQPGCRPDPDPPGHHRRPHPVRPPPAIRRPHLRPRHRPRHSPGGPAPKATTGATTR